MNRGAKTTLGIFLVLIAIAGLLCGSWFIFRGERAASAATMINKGDSFLAAGDLTNALLSYKKAQIMTPHSFAPYFKQGVLAKNTGHYTEAISYINKSTQFFSSDVAVFLTLGDTYLLNNDTVNAKAAFNEAKKIDPQNDEVVFKLLEVSLKENKLDQAENYLTEAMKSSSNPKYTIYLALIDAFNDPSKALDDISKINIEVQINEMTLADFTALFQKMGETENQSSREVMLYQAFNQIGEVEFALAGLEKISATNPQMRDVWLFLSYGYLLKNNAEKAKSAAEKAIEIDPAFAYSHYLLGKYYDQKGKYEQAKEEYDKANQLGFSPENILNKSS
jgi:tetratricopeptide (TPR) repeat protein